MNIFQKVTSEYLGFISEFYQFYLFNFLIYLEGKCDQKYTLYFGIFLFFNSKMKKKRKEKLWKKKKK